uniref:Uncharacterized protein n=1 Tax=Plectus sambesii TaxID=2011161 RepID=A0A914X684_9BILA
MADIVGPLRPSDSWSTTEVRSLQHSHVWTIRGFSQCECRYLETSVKPGQNSADSSNLTFRIRLHPQGNKESNKDFTFFQVFCNSSTAKYRAKFAVYNSRNEEIATTIYTGTQQLHGYFEYIRRDLLVNHIQPQDELQLVLNLTITFDTVTKSSQATRTGQPECKPAEIAKDLETLYKDGRLTDFTIVVGDKDLPAHRAVLSARSPMFAGMLEAHTDESKSGRVVIPDVDYEVMQELLFFMYSGRSPNLPQMAPELLAAADRFQLPGLKDMADQVLRSNLMVDTVCRILVLADMHTARELKQDAIRFVAQNSSQVIQTEGWSEMVKQHADLVTEVVSAISSEQPRSQSTSTSTSGSGGGSEPSNKRSRLGN